MSGFGFQALAYAGPETGMKDKVSYAVRQHKLTFVLTTPLRTDNEIADHVYKHGDGVKFLALKVDDATSAWEETTKRGGKTYMEPKKLNDKDGEVVLSGIHTYGDTVHLFVERKNYSGAFMPGFRAWSNLHFAPKDTGLQYVDHCVGNVGWDQMNPWVKFYEEVMGFKNILTFIQTQTNKAKLKQVGKLFLLVVDDIKSMPQIVQFLTRMKNFVHSAAEVQS